MIKRKLPLQFPTEALKSGESPRNSSSPQQMEATWDVPWSVAPLDQNQEPSLESPAFSQEVPFVSSPTGFKFKRELNWPSIRTSVADMHGRMELGIRNQATNKIYKTLSTFSLSPVPLVFSVFSFTHMGWMVGLTRSTPHSSTQLSNLQF